MVFSVGVSQGTVVQDDQAPDAGRAEIAYGQPIDSGFVILNGQYLPPPYTVGLRGVDVFVNGHWIPVEGLMGRFRGHGPRGRSMGFGRGWLEHKQDRRSLMAARVERQLGQKALLIILGNETAGFVHSPDAIFILDILLSDAASETKVKSLMQQDVSWISSADWSRVVEKFQPTPELSARVLPLADKYNSTLEENAATHGRLKWYAFLDSEPVKYGVTVTAMLLAVVATGSLLTHRPASGGRWRETNSGSDSMGMVVRNVVLLSLLGGFDLLLTLAAQQAGGFLELNPIGVGLIGSPILLCAFKIAAFVGACAILVKLRHYRGAQIASWWLCLVCTILTYRWLTFNSLFLA